MQDLYYKDTRVSPSSSMGLALLELKNPKLDKTARDFLERLVERIYQDCQAEYRKWNP